MLYFQTLFFPVMTMMGLASLYGWILRNREAPQTSTLLLGLLFGFVTILAMIHPIRIQGAVIFDLRGLFVGLAVILAGWGAGAMTVVLAIAYRIWLGDDGAVGGSLGIFVAFGAGLLWRVMQTKVSSSRILSDAGFGAVIALAAFAFEVISQRSLVSSLSDIAPLVIFSNIIGAMGLGYVLRREELTARDLESLRLSATVDPLTNILNRRGAEDHWAQMNAKTANGGALFYIDIDHFKFINDRYGHNAGDATLTAVAARIKNAVRDPMVFSRHGGDEFTLFIPNIGEDHVRDIGHRLCHIVRSQPIGYNGHEIPVTISVGGSWTDRPATFDDMLARADSALMEAKDSGRDQISINGVATSASSTTKAWKGAAMSVH